MPQSEHENAFTIEQKQKLQHIVEFYFALANMRHPAVKAHSERVACTARAAAKILQKDEHAAFVAGALHDIGKVVLPYSLFDGHDITDEEYQAVKEHVQIGYEALKDQFLFTALVAGMHHALSQNGYGIKWTDMPAGLGNHTVKKILEISTLVSICDFADAYLNRSTKPKDGSGGRDLSGALSAKFPDDKGVIQAVMDVIKEQSEQVKQMEISGESPKI